MDLAEMIDAAIDNGDNGASIVETLIAYGHLPSDANTRPAWKTVNELNAFGSICQLVDEWRHQ